MSLVLHLIGVECCGLNDRPDWLLHLVHGLLCGVTYDVLLCNKIQRMIQQH